MAKCAACGKFLSPVGAATCATCPCLFHKACVAFHDNAILPKEWICPECKKKQRKGDNSSTPIKNICGISGPSIHDTQMDDGGKTGSPAKDDIRKSIAECMNEIREFRMEFRTSMEQIRTRMDDFDKRLQAVEQKNAVAPPIEQVAELQRSVAQLQRDLNERDQQALLCDLDIALLPEDKGENVQHTVTLLAAKLGITLDDRDIIFAERVGAAEYGRDGETKAAGRVRRVVVRLARRQQRDDLIRAARVRRNLNTADMGLAGPPRKIYINERLTRTNRQLFYHVREECRKQQWRYSWTKRGRIYVRQGDGRQVYNIRSEDDLSRVFKVDKV